MMIIIMIINRIKDASACCASGPKVIKLVSCSSQLRLKFILLINVKMPTIVGILTFITSFGGLNLKFQFIWTISSFYELFKIYAQLS